MSGLVAIRRRIRSKPSLPPHKAPHGSWSLISRGKLDHSAAVTYGRFATQRAKRHSLSRKAVSRSPQTQCSCSTTPRRWALCRATCSAPKAQSTAQTWACGRVCARLIARLPLPVPTSRRASWACGWATHHCCARRAPCSTSNSLSGRGMRTCESTANSSDQNSCLPVMYCTGSPCNRLVQLPCHNFLKLIQGKLDTMVSEAALGKVVRPDTLAAVTATNLRPALFREVCLALAFENVHQPGA